VTGGVARFLLGELQKGYLDLQNPGSQATSTQKYSKELNLSYISNFRANHPVSISQKESHHIIWSSIFDI